MVETPHNLQLESAPPAAPRSWLQRWQRRIGQRCYALSHPRLMQTALQDSLAAQIAQSELLHQGQIAVYIERELPGHYIHADRSARERAAVLFGKLGVWDTEHNNGVLIYLLEAEHAIEIIADRGVLACTEPAEWAAIAQHLAQLLQAGQVAEGLQLAIEEVGALLQRHYPRQADGVHGNEVPDLPSARY